MPKEAGRFDRPWVPPEVCAALGVAAPPSSDLRPVIERALHDADMADVAKSKSTEL